MQDEVTAFGIRNRRGGAVTGAGAWFNQRFRSQAARYSMYCFPFAGGSASYYANWAEHFTGAIELVPIQLPGRSPRMAESPATSIGDVADEVAELISASARTQPLLFGHSMGAILAFEVAKRLQALRRPASYLFLSGRPEPSIVRPATPTSTRPRREFIQMLRDYACADEALLANDEILDLLLPMMRADFTMIEQYRHRPGSPLDCPILAWCGSSDPEISPTTLMRGWEKETSARFELIVRPGGHFFITSHRVGVVRAVHDAVAGLASEWPISPAEPA
jgi:surfactin synthase thioesterase subunit